MRRAQTLAEQAVTRGELAALADGPWRGAWYWRADLEARQASARRRHARGATARLDNQCHYQPTEQWVPSPLEPEVSGRAWTYHPPDTPQIAAGAAVTATPAAPTATTSRSTAMDEGVSTR